MSDLDNPIPPLWQRALQQADEVDLRDKNFERFIVNRLGEEAHDRAELEAIGIKNPTTSYLTAIRAEIAQMKENLGQRGEHVTEDNRLAVSEAGELVVEGSHVTNLKNRKNNGKPPNSLYK